MGKTYNVNLGRTGLLEFDKIQNAKDIEGNVGEKPLGETFAVGTLLFFGKYIRGCRYKSCNGVKYTQASMSAARHGKFKYLVQLRAGMSCPQGLLSTTP